jgi:hypothetical protein
VTSLYVFNFGTKSTFVLFHISQFLWFLGFFRQGCKILSAEAKDAADRICWRLQLGSKLSEIIETKEDACALFDLYKNEQYLLTDYKGKFCVSSS